MTDRELPPLPPPPITRWTAQRKAALLLAVTTRQLTIAQAYRRYGIEAGEIAAWLAAFKAHGTDGLKITRLQKLRGRQPRPRRPKTPPK